MKLLALSLALLTGCSIEKFNKPPDWASIVTTHERFFGLNADIPAAGSSVLRVQLGWGSHTFSVIPVSTNRAYAATVSDAFSLSQSISPLDTGIKESLQTGFEPMNVPPVSLRLLDRNK